MEPDQPDTEAVAVLPRRVMRADQLDAGDGLKLAAALQCLADHGNAEAIAPPITN